MDLKNDQASRLREMAEKSLVKDDSFARVIAVTSGKGGVGKTSFTSNLAIELASLGKKVVVLDADLGLANTDIMLGLNPKYNLSHVVRGQKTLKEVIIDVGGDFKLIPASSGVAELADINEYDMKRIVSEFTAVDKDTDIFLIDTAAGIAKNVINFLVASDEVILFSTKEPTSITDAYALVKTLVNAKRDAKIKLVVNMCNSEQEAQRIADKLCNVCLKFLGVSVEYIGYVLSDPAVSQAIVRRNPLVKMAPNSKAAKCIRVLSKKIAGAVVKHNKRKSFFEKLSGVFNNEN